MRWWLGGWVPAGMACRVLALPSPLATHSQDVFNGPVSPPVGSVRGVWPVVVLVGLAGAPRVGGQHGATQKRGVWKRAMTIRHAHDGSVFFLFFLTIRKHATLTWRHPVEGVEGIAWQTGGAFAGRGAGTDGRKVHSSFKIYSLCRSSKKGQGLLMRR